MMNLRAVATLLATIGVFASVCNAQDKAPVKPSGGMTGIALFEAMMNDPKACVNYYMGLPSECCQLPMVPWESFASCALQTGVSPQRFRKSGPKGAGTVPAENTNGTSGQPVQRLAQGGAAKGGPACMMKCIAERHGLFAEDGTVDKDKTKELFLANSNEAFKDIVSTAVDRCYTNYLKKTNPTEKSTSTSCATAPSQFMMCVCRDVELKCPSSAKGPKSASCAKRAKDLARCDPFYVAKSKAGK